MSDKKEFAVGDKLWLVPGRGMGLEREVAITKIGRRWLETDANHVRVDKISLWVDGGKYSSPGRCYRSREEYLEESAASKLWKDFTRAIDRLRSRPEGMKIGTILEAASILGVQLSAEKSNVQ